MQNEQNDTVDVLGGSTIKECAKNNSVKKRKIVLESARYLSQIRGRKTLFGDFNGGD
jgi:hypothetical protein